MLLDIVNRILITVFFMSCLTTLRHGYYFIQTFVSSTNEEPVKYRISKLSLLFLCLSIGYILTSILMGIKQ